MRCGWSGLLLLLGWRTFLGFHPHTIAPRWMAFTKSFYSSLPPSSTVRTSQMLLFLCAFALAMLSQGNFVRHDCGWPANPKDERQNPLIGRFAGPNPLRGKEGGSAANGHFSGNAVNLAGCCLPTSPLINFVRMDSNCLGL